MMMKQIGRDYEDDESVGGGDDQDESYPMVDQFPFVDLGFYIWLVHSVQNVSSNVRMLLQ